MWQLKYIIRFLIVIPGIFSLGQSWAQPFRYAETVFQEVDTLTNVSFATVPWLNNHIALAGDIQLHAGENKTQDRSLEMDIFFPKNDSVAKRPAIIFAHSGGFLLGSRKNDDMLALCDSFARRGYVTATFDYRIGIGSTVTTFLGFILHVAVNTENAMRAVYRATQDSRAAIRFLKQNAELYGIDTTKIYMSGSSAGAFMALHNVYLNSSSEIPQEIFNSPGLGGLDSIGVSGFNANPNAVVSMWGALQKTELIADNSTPILLIHGESDDIVPFKKGVPLKTLVPNNSALEYNMDETYGSFCIDTALQNRGILHQTYFVPNKGHEFYGVNTGMFPDSGPNEYWDIIQNKMAVFLLEQFKPSAKFEVTTNDLTADFINSSEDKRYSEWNFGDGFSEKGIVVNHTFLQEGNYMVSLKTCNENLACDTISKWIKIEKGNPIDTIPNNLTSNKKQELLLFPNPTNTEIRIKGISGSFNVTIYNSVGQVVRKIIHSENPVININQLKNGIYILQLRSDEKRKILKFVKSD